MVKFSKLLEQILKEYSPQDPIPEINRRKKRLAIFLIGGPASGKTTFYKDFIVPKQGRIKRFSTDDVSDLRRKYDPEWAHKEKGQYVPGSATLRRKYIEVFAENTNGENIVVDTTGRDPDKVRPTFEALVENGYDVLFVHLFIPVEKALARVRKRNVGKTQPETDIEFTKGVYTPKQQLERPGPEDIGDDEDIEPVFEPGKFASFAKETLSTAKIQNVISEYSNWSEVIGYYIVAQVENKNIFMKYENGKLKIRKADKYVSVN